MLKQRLATSAVLITLASLLIFLDGRFPLFGAPGLWLLPLLAFFSLGTAWDISSLLRQSGRLISRRVTLAATAVVTFSSCVPLLWPVFGLEYPPNCPIGRLGWIVVGSFCAMFGILLTEMYSFGLHVKNEPPAGGDPKQLDDRQTSTSDATAPGGGESRTIRRTLSSVFVSQYVGLPAALAVSLRTMDVGNWGLWALLTTVAVTKSADAGAYFAGKTFGRNKLVPRLSPGKTQEGAIGGIVTATIVAFVCLSQLFPDGSASAQVSRFEPSIPLIATPLWGALLLGPLLATAGMVGDLAESLVKRDSGAKDSGDWLPGLGGVWDVTDSLIAAILPAFLCFAAGVGG